MNSTRTLPKTHNSRSSIIFYFLLCLTIFWDFVITIISIVLQALKLYNYPAPKSPNDFSMCAPFLWFLICYIKFQCGKHGNRSEHFGLMIAAIIFLIGSILFELYFIFWQPYLWSWEMPLHIVSIVLDGIAIIASIILMIIFIVANK